MFSICYKWSGFYPFFRNILRGDLNTWALDLSIPCYDILALFDSCNWSSVCNSVYHIITTIFRKKREHIITTVGYVPSMCPYLLLVLHFRTWFHSSTVSAYLVKPRLGFRRIFFLLNVFKLIYFINHCFRLEVGFLWQGWLWVWRMTNIFVRQGWLPGLKGDGDSNQLPTIAIVASYDTFGAAPVWTTHCLCIDHNPECTRGHFHYIRWFHSAIANLVYMCFTMNIARAKKDEDAQLVCACWIWSFGLPSSDCSFVSYMRGHLIIGPTWFCLCTCSIHCRANFLSKWATMALVLRRY